MAAEADRPRKLRGSRFLITYQCQLDKEDIVTWFSENIEGVKGLHACHEVAPTTGRRHTHVLLWCKRIQRVMPVVRGLFTVRAHPPDDIKVVNTDEHWNRAVEYMNKEDPEPLHIGKGKTSRDWSDHIESIGKKRRFIDAATDPELAPIIASRLEWARMVFDGAHEQKPPDLDIRLRSWQEQMMRELRKPPVRRQIWWIWSSESETGKTTFMDYVSRHMEVLPMGVSLTNLAYAYHGQAVLHLNIPRHQDVTPQILFLLETTSDQTLVLSGKYRSMEKRFTSHVVVTANIPPPTADLPRRLMEIHVPEFPLSGPIPLDSVALDHQEPVPEVDEWLALEERARGCEPPQGRA